MKRMRLKGGLATLVVLALASTGQGFGFRSAASYRSAYYHPTYYYPVAAPRLVYYPVVRVPVVYCAPLVPVLGQPVVVQPRPIFAVPQAAPPSQTSEPPMGANGSRAPIIHESRSQGSKYSPQENEDPAKSSLRVGFWNLTGRNVKLIVDGQSRLLERDRAITLDLGRRFTWQLDANQPQRVHVSADQTGYEVILRN
jgi:hypothetical protein